MQGGRRCLVCNCEKTMPLDEGKLSKAMGEKIDTIHMSLCRAQVESFENALQSGDDLLVACTQEAPLFTEIAEEQGGQNDVRFVNIREAAGWSKEAGKATPKIAALLKSATYDPKPARLKSVFSDGMCLIYGAGDQALEAAKVLSSRLSVTLLLSDDTPVNLPIHSDVPIYRGDIVQAFGSFGNFSVTVDNYAPLRPASKAGPEFAVARNGATSSCSLILDLSGASPLFSGHQHRDGYERADPGDPAMVLRKAFILADMIGEFEKPIYVDYNADTCAHSRSQITGCSKCLDNCPAGAITEAGDGIEIDSGICGGCGTCQAVCPTGSITYNYPAREDTIHSVQSLISDFGEAGGKHPELLIHDGQWGLEAISLLARHGDGLPSNVLPIAAHSVTSIGHVELLGCITSGAASVTLLANPQLGDELQGLETEVILANSILTALLGDQEPRIAILSDADPDVLGSEIWNRPSHKSLQSKKSATFSAVGSKRETARIIFGKLSDYSGSSAEIIPLPEAAPYGRVDIDVEACTLCMACTSACPANAITDTPGEPKLRFVESACVQCGICVGTCPEKALSLLPQLNLTPSAMQPETLHEEEPFLCISCGKPFATRSTIERISDQLAGKHAMFGSKEQSDLIKMCENCRIETQANLPGDPFSSNPRPRPRTTEDYLAAESGKLSASDFMIDDGD